jgi:GT2 family glycosyltransferase
MPHVTIVICTLNRRKLLKECINSICALDYPKSSLEIVIIDGGSTDGTKELCQGFPGIRFITEAKLGLAHARNTGARSAQNEIVAYTDDDCIVDREWLKSLVAGFQVSSSVIGVGGPVYPRNSRSVPRKILVKAALGLFDEGKCAKYVGGLVTSNCAFKREIFASIEFDEKLGVTRRHKLILCGEDTDFCRTIVSSGHRLLYTPSAKVYHSIPKERARVPYIVKHAIHYGIFTTRASLKKRNSRIWAVRFILGRLGQNFLLAVKDTSFTSCYGILYSMSALLICITGLDRVLI